jgi:hypothetical protein
VRFADTSPIVVEDNNDTAVRTHNLAFKTPTLTDYTSRVYPIASFAWDASQPAGTGLSEIILPDVFFGFRAIQEKLSRFRFLRASFKITIRLNGTSFHYGKLIAAWSPCPEPFSNNALTARTNNLVSVTSFPHVIISAGVNEVVELDIPFVYPYNYLDLSKANANVNQARIFIYVLNPLKLGSVVPPIDVTVFGNMMDVTLCGYSNKTPVDNSRYLGFSRDIIPNFGRSHQRKVAIDGGIAQTNYMTLNVPQQNNATALTPFELSIGDEAGSAQVDSEMVDYLCPSGLHEIASRPALLTTFEMASSDTVGTMLYDTPVHPCSGQYIAYDNGELDFCSPLKFVSLPCRYWSGSIKYKLQIVASAFHSARVQILYSPEGSSFGVSVTDDAAFELTSHIVDIQCDSEIEFEIPWSSHYPQLAVDGSNLTTASVNGYLGFRVLNVLTYKETPIPPIEFNLWISAGSDFKLYSMTAPLNFDLTVPANVPPMIDGGFAQIADTSRDTKQKSPENLVPFVMGNYVSTPSATEVSTLHHAFNSTAPLYVIPPNKSLLENCLRGVTPTSNDLYGQSGYLSFISDPVLPSTVISFPYYDWYNLLFRFRRGSYVYTAMSLDLEDTSPINGTLLATSGVISTGNSVYSAYVDNGTIPTLLSATIMPSVLSTFGSLQPFSVRMPYTSTSKIAITSCNTSAVSPLYPSNNFAQAISIASQRSSCLVYRSAGSDMKFYFQVGAPAVFTKN